MRSTRTRCNWNSRIIALYYERKPVRSSHYLNLHDSQRSYAKRQDIVVTRSKSVFRLLGRTYSVSVHFLMHNGVHLTSKLFRTQCTMTMVKHLLTTAYHTQTNMQVERFNCPTVMRRNIILPRIRRIGEHMCNHWHTRTTRRCTSLKIRHLLVLCSRSIRRDQHGFPTQRNSLQQLCRQGSMSAATEPAEKFFELQNKANSLLK